MRPKAEDPEGMGRRIPGVRCAMVYPREDGPIAWPAVERAASWLLQRGVRVLLPDILVAQASFKAPDGCVAVCREDLPDGLDLVVALGGDGTLLRASRWIGDRPVPVVGVNLGDLGFLSAYSKEGLLDMLEDAVEGRLRWEPRLRMKVEIHRGEEIYRTHAVNDAYIKHGEIPRLLRLATYIGEHYSATYKSDGLIVCTPLGSTAYNMAAGGPIVEPGTDAFTVTPICPHSLTHRPVVVSAEVKIRVVYVGPNDISSASLTADGQWSHELQLGDEIHIEAASEPLRLVSPHTSVFQVLATKMGWSGPD